MQGSGFTQVDLAGGVGLGIVPRHRKRRLSAFIEVSGLTTNTTCSYFANKFLEIELTKSYLNRPKSASLGFYIFT